GVSRATTPSLAGPTVRRAIHRERGAAAAALVPDRGHAGRPEPGEDPRDAARPTVQREPSVGDPRPRLPDGATSSRPPRTERTRAAARGEGICGAVLPDRVPRGQLLDVRGGSTRIAAVGRIRSMTGDTSMGFTAVAECAP